MGNRVNGLPQLSPCNSSMLPASPSRAAHERDMAASVSSCRRIRLPVDPRASRSATSRERSDARAANRLPRFAQAATELIPPAPSSRDERSHRALRRNRRKVRPAPVKKSFGLVVFGIGLRQATRRSNPDRRSACAGVYARLQMAHHLKADRLPRAFRWLSPSTCSWFTMGTQKSGEKNNNVPWNSGSATPTMVKGCLLS